MAELKLRPKLLNARELSTDVELEKPVNLQSLLFDVDSETVCSRSVAGLDSSSQPWLIADEPECVIFTAQLQKFLDLHLRPGFSTIDW